MPSPKKQTKAEKNKASNDDYNDTNFVNFSVAETGTSASATRPYNPYHNTAGNDRSSNVGSSSANDTQQTGSGSAVGSNAKNSGLGTSGGGGGRNQQRAPQLTAITTDEAGNSMTGSFVRYQFFKDHRASATAPKEVFVDSIHADCAEAADYSLARSSHLNAKASSLSANNNTSFGGKKQQQQQTSSSSSNDPERARLLGGGGNATGDSNTTDNDDAAKVVVEEEAQVSSTSRRFLSYFFSMDSVEKRKKTLTALTLLGIMFTNSIGGGYGLENSIGSGGAFITILGVLLVPFLWALPVCFVVAELSTSVPSNGGYLMWINVSMPSPVYFFATVTTVLLMFIDNAVFPALFSDYFCQVVECSDYLRKGTRLMVLAATCILNLIGTEAVGWMTVLITIMSVAPFASMFIIYMIKSGGYVNWENMSSIPSDIQWAGLASTLAWNYAGFEQAGSVAEDVKDPQKSFVRAAIPLVGLAWLSYIPPIIAGVSRTHGAEDWSVWDSGYFATVSEDIAGSGFKMFVVVGGLFSAFGLLLSCLCLSSRTLAGTGEAAAFPRPISNLIFKYNKRFGTPHYAILINTFFTGVCAVSLDFGALLAIDQALYGIRILLIFLACIRLRYAFPELHRPFRIPLSNDWLVVALVVPILFSFGLIIICAMVDTPTMIGFGSVVVVVSIISYLYCRYIKPHGFDGKIMGVYAVDGLMARKEEEDGNGRAGDEGAAANVGGNICPDDIRSLN